MRGLSSGSGDSPGAASSGVLARTDPGIRVLGAWAYGDLHVLEPGQLQERSGLAEALAEARNVEFPSSCTISTGRWMFSGRRRRRSRRGSTSGRPTSSKWTWNLAFYGTTSVHFEVGDDDLVRVRVSRGRTGPFEGRALGCRAGGGRSRGEIATTLPVHHWVFSGNTVEVSTVAEVRQDLRGWERRFVLCVIRGRCRDGLEGEPADAFARGRPPASSPRRVTRRADRLRGYSAVSGLFRQGGARALRVKAGGARRQ